MSKEKKSNRFQARSFARRVALQLLYQEDLNPGGYATVRDDFIFNELRQLCDGSEFSGLSEETEESPINEDITINNPISRDDLAQLAEFIRDVTSYALANREMIDEKIASFAKNWSIDRMAKTDRNILRLAIAESLSRETPKAVVIHEALELGGQFGSGQSISFLNGVLDKVIE